ncbi:MAG: formate dehydrogenase accessory sulfurtransferase FdhD [Chloroflexi bacterium]|nr:formate dehydrogenase accessory sulfurtransferase FdhD [Chloroflexota bacterium]
MIDTVAAERSILLKINGEPVVSLLCTPSDIDALAVGFLISEGFLSAASQPRSVAFDEKKLEVAVEAELPAGWRDMTESRAITPGCGRGVTFTASSGAARLKAVKSRVKSNLPEIRAIVETFRRQSLLYASTGGVHSAAIFGGKIMLFFAEDIGRHNAVDKVIGMAALSGALLDDKILVSSGRVSGEIMTKVVRSGIPVIVSRGAPTCVSVSRAEDSGVTLVGFARGNRMNIYSHPWRIIQ